ncbi:hypothetical protein D3C76_1090020 [compost metagenome]
MGLDICAAVGSDVDRILDAIAIGVATAVLTNQARPAESKAQARKLGIAQSSGEWIVAAQLDVDRGLVLDRRNALDVLLINAAWTPLPTHAWEVHVAAGIHDWRVVQVDVSVSRRAIELPFAYGQKDACDVGRL